MKPREIRDLIENKGKKNPKSALPTPQNRPIAYLIGILIGAAAFLGVNWLAWNYVGPLFGLPKLDFIQFVAFSWLLGVLGLYLRGGKT